MSALLIAPIAGLFLFAQSHTQDKGKDSMPPPTNIDWIFGGKKATWREFKTKDGHYRMEFDDDSNTFRCRVISHQEFHFGNNPNFNFTIVCSRETPVPSEQEGGTK